MNAPLRPPVVAPPLAGPGALDLAALIEGAALLPPDTLARARRVRAETGERLDSILTRLGFLSEQRLVQAIADATGFAAAGPEDYPAEPVDSVAPLSAGFLRESRAAPLRRTEAGVEVAFADPLDPFPAQALAVALGAPVRPRVGRATDIEAALDRLYGPESRGPDAAVGGDEEEDVERLRDLASDAPAIRAVNRLVTAAVERRASDIHLEPSEFALLVRFRVDGVLQEVEALPAGMRASLPSRIKVMAGLNIAERRLPQDGRMRLTVRGHDIDLRVATAPTIHGESVVLRLLDRSQLQLDFDALGFDDAMQARLSAVLAQPHGILLVTGPTGSGKTTTLYAALSRLNAPERKLLTVEDPIEYRLSGVQQTQVAPAIGMSFAAALRAFLRHDPDVIMVGEVRDLETAQVAVQAALTGHMILSTLHTNSAASAVTRLLDMGVEPFLITSTLRAVLAQRLVRRLCPTCRAPTAVAEAREALAPAGARIAHAWRATGCAQCGGSGYRGRVALAELLRVDEAVARGVLDRAEAGEVEAAAVAGGMTTLLEDGALKVDAGLTTVEEVLRVTGDGA